MPRSRPGAAVAPAIVLALLGSATAASAWTSPVTLRPLGPDAFTPPQPWGTSDYCFLSYYNVCSGWVYGCDGSASGDVVGLEFKTEDCADGIGACTRILRAWIYLCDLGPAYEPTCTTAGIARQGDQPGHLGEIVSVPYCPPRWYEGWNIVTFDPPVTVDGGGIFYLTWDRDPHPRAVVDARPMNCSPNEGGCMSDCPAPARSYRYGNIATGSFSGSQFYYGVYYESACDLLVRVVVSCAGPTAVEGRSWGRVKALYR
jgi:hypothetical protein